MTIVTNVIYIIEYHKNEDIRFRLFELTYDQMIVPYRTLCRKECISNEKHEEVQLRHNY